MISLVKPRSIKHKARKIALSEYDSLSAGFPKCDLECRGGAAAKILPLALRGQAINTLERLLVPCSATKVKVAALTVEQPPSP